MWLNILNNPDKRIKIHKDIEALMNVPVDYDDEVERDKTKPLLLLR